MIPYRELKRQQYIFIVKSRLSFIKQKKREYNYKLYQNNINLEKIEDNIQELQVFDEPILEVNKIEEQLVEEVQVFDEPIIEEPLVEEVQVFEELQVFDEPIIEEPIIEEPIIEEPHVQEPHIEEHKSVEKILLETILQLKNNPSHFQTKSKMVFINIDSDVEEEYNNMSNYSKYLIMNKLISKNTNTNTNTNTYNIHINHNNINI